jgi:hypothetical protein
MFDGQEIVGRVVSLTVMVKPQLARLPEVSVAVQVTVVVPTEKNEPERGVQLTVAPGQLSKAEGAG